MKSTESPRQQLLARFRRVVRKGDGFLVGAAVGAGMTARAALAGGADFLVALTAGRMRIMGVQSLACLFPVMESNELVDSFAGSEILSNSSGPVFLGVSSLNPDLDLNKRITEVAEAGFPGVINWPTSIHYPPGFQRLLDRSGVGFAREVEMLRTAIDAGLCAIAYVRTPGQARDAVLAGIELICLNFGWSTGGANSVRSELTLEDIGLEVRAVSRALQRTGKPCLLLLAGGPLETSDQLGPICKTFDVCGYIGGSTLERLPVEDSVTSSTIAFKNTAANYRRASRQSSELERWASEHQLTGNSAAMLLLVEKLRRLSTSRDPVFLFGEPGTPVRESARAIHLAGEASEKEFVMLSARNLTAAQLERRLFDDRSGQDYRSLADQEIGTMLVEHLELVPLRMQARLARYLLHQTFAPPGSRRSVRGRARLILGATRSPSALVETGTLHESLARLLGAGQVRMPPLAERTDDIEALFTQFAATGTSSKPIQLSPIALRQLMVSDWPRNDAQLKQLVEKLIADGASGVISATELDPHLNERPARVSERIASERDLLLDALWRHSFHREKTARALGISRKTLYNKMKQYRLTNAG